MKLGEVYCFGGSCFLKNNNLTNFIKLEYNEQFPKVDVKCSDLKGINLQNFIIV